MSKDKSKVSRLIVSAACLSAGFFFMAYFAVSLSTFWAAQHATTVQEFHDLELRNGIIFSGICSIGLFGIIYSTLRWLDQKKQEASDLDKRIQCAEGRLATTMVVHTVVHDTNNLLGVIRSGLCMLKDQEVGVDPASLCNRMGTAVDRVEDMHRQLMRRERELHDREATLDVFALEDALKELQSYARLHPRLKDCDLTFSGGDNLRLRANRTEFAQAILNLILNAADATNNEGRIKVEACEEGGQIRLEVDDDGPGIPEENRDRIFNAFVSGKEHGMGLGLISVQGFCERAKGRVEVGVSRWNGARFVVFVPMAAAEKASKEVRDDQFAALSAT